MTQRSKPDPQAVRRRQKPQRRNAVQSSPPLPKTSKGRATRRSLKSALSKLLQDRAFEEIRLKDIAVEADVPVSLFYHYFQSKVDITYEVLSDLLDSFRTEVATRPKDSRPWATIHYANERMVALYSSHSGAMRCLLQTHEGMAPFAPMWREYSLEWNKRIAASISKQFPDAFENENQYISLAYALGGTADNFLYEYFVQKNTVLRKSLPRHEEVAAFLTTLWYRALYLRNPPDDIGVLLPGFSKLGGKSPKSARKSPRRSSSGSS